MSDRPQEALRTAADAMGPARWGLRASGPVLQMYAEPRAGVVDLLGGGGAVQCEGAVCGDDMLAVARADRDQDGAVDVGRRPCGRD